MEKLPFFAPQLERSLMNPTQEALRSVVDLLGDGRLGEETAAGNITLAMIRPNVGPDANNQGLSDAQAASEIENKIYGLGVLAKFSFTFTHSAAGEFYQGGPQQSMANEPPRDPSAYTSRWPEFIDFMASGPTTVLLLYSPDGDAIPKWRSHLGHWNIDEVRDMDTIRGQLGVNKYNNLVHGSDAPEAVVRELGIIKNTLKSELSNLQAD